MRPTEEEKPQKPALPEQDEPEKKEDWVPREAPDHLPAERSDKPADPSQL